MAIAACLCPGDADHERKRAQKQPDRKRQVKGALDQNGWDHLPEFQFCFLTDQECPPDLTQAKWQDIIEQVAFIDRYKRIMVGSFILQ